jgi:hypothetical protein
LNPRAKLAKSDGTKAMTGMLNNSQQALSSNKSKPDAKRKADQHRPEERDS